MCQYCHYMWQWSINRLNINHWPLSKVHGIGHVKTYSIYNIKLGVNLCTNHQLNHVKVCEAMCIKKKITKKLNSKENSKQKVPNQMAKSNKWTTMSYSWLILDIFSFIKWWIKPDFIASLTSHLHDSHIKNYHIDNKKDTSLLDIGHG